MLVMPTIIITNHTLQTLNKEAYMPSYFIYSLTAILLALSLSGCVVASAVDLAATTVFTAGKIVVRTTGAVVNAVIPDGDKKENNENKKVEQSLERPQSQSLEQSQQAE